MRGLLTFIVLVSLSAGASAKEGLTWRRDFTAAQREAEAAGKPLLVCLYDDT